MGSRMWGKLWALSFLIDSLQTGPTSHELSNRGEKSEDADIIVLSSTAGAAEWMLAFSVPFLFCTSVKLAGLSEGGLCTRKAADLPPGFFAWGKDTGEVQSAHRHQALTTGYNAAGQQIPFFLCPRQCFMGKEQVDGESWKERKRCAPYLFHCRHSQNFMTTLVSKYFLKNNQHDL